MRADHICCDMGVHSLVVYDSKLSGHIGAVDLALLLQVLWCKLSVLMNVLKLCAHIPSFRTWARYIHRKRLLLFLVNLIQMISALLSLGD